MISKEKKPRNLIAPLILLAAFAFGRGNVDATASSAPPKPSMNLTAGEAHYGVGFAHLGTQRRWAYPKVIPWFLSDTLNANFALAWLALDVTDVSPVASSMTPTTAAVKIARPVFTIESFSAADGKDLVQPAPAVHRKAGEPWTINCFIRPDQDPDAMVVIAGFGRCSDDVDGVGRYLCKFPEGVHYWSRNRDVDSNAALETQQWQMLSATYDGKTLTLYKNGAVIGQAELTLTDDESTVRLAPVDPWTGDNRFVGEIRHSEIWNTALSNSAVRGLWERHPPLAAVNGGAGERGPVAGPGGVRITIDTSQAPDLAGWAAQKLMPALREWYPRIAAELPVAGHMAPDHFSIVFDKNYKGVAATVGTHIIANPTWFRAQLKGEAVGALVHEEVHVVQLPLHMRGNHMPTWLLEGSADYFRWFQFEPPSLRPHPQGDAARYDGSYRITASFLAWVVIHYDKDIVTQMNAANYAGTYSDDLWVKYTGKTAADLGAEWKASLAKKE